MFVDVSHEIKLYGKLFQGIILRNSNNFKAIISEEDNDNWILYDDLKHIYQKFSRKEEEDTLKVNKKMTMGYRL